MPDWRNEIARKLSGLKLSPVREAEIIEEFNDHLEDRYQNFRVLASHLMKHIAPYSRICVTANCH